MRIILLIQFCDPEPTTKGLLFAKELVKLGHEVEIITGFPNYPGGKIYPNYKISWLKKEIIEKVQITRVPLYPSHDASVIRRILNYGSFCISSCLYGVFGAKRADVMYVYHPPLTVGISAAIISLFRRIPFVYDIQDMWPDTLQAVGMLNHARFLKLVGKMCDWVYRRAAAITVSSPGFSPLLIERGVPKEKITVIYNWCDENALKNSATTDSAKFGMSDRFNIVFAGTMGKGQGLDTVLDAANIVISRAPSIQFVFIGGGTEVERLKKRAMDMQLKNVLFLARMPMAEVSQVLVHAQVLLVHLKDDPLFAITIPSKTQAYLSIGKPILMAVKGNAAKLVNQANAGITVKPGDVESIAQGAIALSALSIEELARLGQQGSAYYQEHLSLQKGVNHFVSVFKSVSFKE